MNTLSLKDVKHQTSTLYTTPRVKIKKNQGITF